MLSKDKADAVRYALLCYENQHRGTNWRRTIFKRLKLKEDILFRSLHMH